MTLTVREAKILNAAIEAFIETGEPVSSQRLYNGYRFGIKPAMIRHELEALTEDGYLAQPYHSAGRIPLDKGFDFFARCALSESCENRRQAQNDFQRLFAAQAWDDLLAEFAEDFGVAGVLGDARGEVTKEGLDYLVEHLAWETPQELQRVVRDFLDVDERIGEIMESWKGAPLQIFIGRSPVTESEELSVVMGRYQSKDGDVALCAIGPKRMNYRRVIHVMRNMGANE
ncbi:MAG: hypothetical protein HYW65_03975 [Candidatus Liptonbacteria bacterium]|nr:hypothetical protein [Candidatus Liptonbacteria bacterium]